MDSEEVMEQQGMRLRVAFLHWMGCTFGFLLFLGLAIGSDIHFLQTMWMFLYIAVGIYLNRVVLRQVIEWHPMYNTLDNVVRSKLFYFALWPLAYLQLFIRLGINKIL